MGVPLFGVGGISLWKILVICTIHILILYIHMIYIYMYIHTLSYSKYIRHHDLYYNDNCSISNNQHPYHPLDSCFSLHQKVGSQSFTGADGATLPSWLERTMTALQVCLSSTSWFYLCSLCSPLRYTIDIYIYIYRIYMFRSIEIICI